MQYFKQILEIYKYLKDFLQSISNLKALIAANNKDTEKVIF